MLPHYASERATVTVVVEGVAQLHDILYIICEWSSTILKFNAVTHQRVKPDLYHKGLKWPTDIAACEGKSRLYLVDSGYVWTVNVQQLKEDIELWLPKSGSNTFTADTLSVTSSRLLVTSQTTKQLIQFDTDGKELRRIRLSDNTEPHHAVESSTGSFIVSHYNIEQKRHQVTRVDADGREVDHEDKAIIDSDQPSKQPRRNSQSLGLPLHVVVDSGGRVIVADSEKRCVQLMYSRLTPRRVIVDEDQLNYDEPRRLCYVERTGQLLVGSKNSVAVFDVLRR